MKTDRFGELSDQFNEMNRVFNMLLEEYPSENVLLADISISQEQFKFLRSLCSSYARITKLINTDVLTTFWTRSEQSAIICFLFAKYGKDPDDRYWESLQSWISPSESNPIKLNQQKIGSAITKFFHEYKLHLAVSRNEKNMMVNSLHTHAIIPRVSARRIFQFLKDEVLHYPFEMDEEEIRDFLLAMINEIAYFEKVVVNDEDFINLPISEYDFSVSAFYRLPKGFVHACSINNEKVLEIIQPVFERVQHAVLSLDNYDEQVEVVEPLEWYLEEEFNTFEIGLLEKKDELNKRLVNRSLKKAYRSPNFAFDCQALSLQLYIPEQRISCSTGRERVHFSIVLEGDRKSSIELECFSTQNYELLTEEAYMPVSGYSHIYQYEICLDSEIVKQFSFQKKPFLIFDSARGDILTLNKSIGHDVYLVVDKESQFESDGFHFVSHSSEQQYSVYYGQIHSDTLFIVNDEIISPSVDQIKRYSISTVQLYNKVELMTADKRLLPVFGSLPHIRVRTQNDIIKVHDFIIMNNKRAPFSILHKYYIADGSGDYLYDIHIDQPDTDNLCNSIVKLYINKDYTYEFGYIEELEYSFRESYYVDPKEVRVKHLYFKGCKDVFTKHYQFPMKSNNTRFKIQTQGGESRLCIQYPKVLYFFDTGELIPQYIHIQQLFHRALKIDSSFEKCFIQYEYGPDKKKLSINGKRISASIKEFSLTELRNNPRLEFGLYVIFGDDDKHMHEKKICDVYTSFKVLDNLSWRFYSKDSSIKMRGHLGEYLSFSAVYDNSREYIGKLTNVQQTSNDIEFVIDNEKIDQDIYIADYPLDGVFQLEIYEKKNVMGKHNSSQTLIYSEQNITLVNGVLVTANDLLNTTWKIKHTLSHTQKKRYSIQINNFYLKITDYDRKNNCYLADGYFINHDKKLYQSFNNPYSITDVSLDKRKIHFSIQDNAGNELAISEYGEVNNLHRYNPYHVSRLSAVILSEENS